jgi:hypothetical protein
MGDDRIFNPFSRSTDPGVTLDDTRELADIEAEEALSEHEREQAAHQHERETAESSV